MVAFNSRKDIENWFKTRPKETMGRESAMLAGRAALRVLPLLVTEFEAKNAKNKNDLHRILTKVIFPVFYVTVAARVMTLAPNRAAAFAVAYAARAAADTVVFITADATRAAADAAYAAIFGSSDATRAAADVAFLARRAAHDSFNTFAVDAVIIERSGWQALVYAPLWPAGEPEKIAQHWKRLSQILVQDNTNWSVWIDALNSLRDGRGLSENELAILSLEGAPVTWEDGYKKCNAWISQQLEEMVDQLTVGLHDDVPLDDQLTGTFHFGIRDGKIVGLPGDPGLFNPSFASTLQSELLKKLKQLVEGGKLHNQSAQISAHLQNLLDVISQPGPVDPGLLLAAARSVLEDNKSFNLPENRRELTPELLASLNDVSESLQDLMAAYPDILKVESVRLAFGLLRNKRRLETYRQKLAEIQRAAQEDETVESSASKALGRYDDLLLKETRTEVIAGLVADKMLVTRNFLVKAEERARPHVQLFVKDAGTAARKGALKGFEQGAKLLVLSPALYLVAKIYAPAAAIALSVPLLNQLAKRLEDMAKKVQQPNSSAKPKKIVGSKKSKSKI
jgi:hypothetical protein